MLFSQQGIKPSCSFWKVMIYSFWSGLIMGSSKENGRGFPGDTVDKNPPAKAGDLGSIPDAERSRNQAPTPWLLSLYSSARARQPLSPRSWSPRSATREGTATRSPHTGTKE